MLAVGHDVPMARPSARSALLWGGGIAISAAFAWLALRDVDWTAAWSALAACNWRWLVPSLLALAAASVVKTLRWQYLFLPGSRPRFRPALVALLVGLFFNTILPARAGEAARVVSINRESATSRGEAATTIVLERVFDVLALLLILFVTLPWLPPLSWVRAAAAMAVAVATGLAVAVVLVARFGDRALATVLRPLTVLPRVTRDHVDRLVRSSHDGLAGIRSARLALASSLLTLASWLLLALSTWCLMEGFGLELPFAAALLVVIAINLALILPSSPGGLGVFEAATLVALRAFGIPDSRAISYALALHAVNLIPYLAAGAVLLRRNGNRPLAHSAQERRP